MRPLLFFTTKTMFLYSFIIRRRFPLLQRTVGGIVVRYGATGGEVRGSIPCRGISFVSFLLIFFLSFTKSGGAGFGGRRRWEQEVVMSCLGRWGGGVQGVIRREKD